MRAYRTVFLSLILTLTGLMVAKPASATELWDPPLRGVNEGLATGAALPPGVYGILNNYWASYNQYDSDGHKTGLKLDALVEVPIVLWQTGYKVWDADFAMAIAQPFDYTTVKMPGTAAISNNGHWGTFNTVLIPAMLHWGFEHNLHLTTSLAVYVDDATSSPADPPGGGGVGSGNGFWSLEPDVAVSWLSDGWNASIHMRYVYNFKNTKTHYHSGSMIAVDYTLTKTLGNWTIGLGAHEQHQITDDSGSGAAACAGTGCRVTNFGMGPIIGYQFGPMALHLVYNQNIYTENDVAGTFVNLRLVAPL